MTYGRLSPEVPLGPFTGSPVTVWSTPGKAAKLHASQRCSRVRSGRLSSSEVPLSTAVERMCPQCAAYGPWARPGTGAGIFLNALTGMGLLYELERYTGPDEDARTDDEVRQAAALLKRVPEEALEAPLPEGQDEPDEGEENGEDEEDWRAGQDARQDRADIFGQWRDAAASLYRAHQLLAPFPWLKPWADAPMRRKASYVSLLQQQARQLTSRNALVVAAGAAAMQAPDLQADDPALAPLGEPKKTASHLNALWRTWSSRAADSWEHPRYHSYIAHQLVHELGARRKGRDAVLRHAQRLVSAWTATAEAAAESDSGERWLLARLPVPRPGSRGTREEPFLHSLSEWELGVLASWGSNADWEHLTLALQVPEPVAAALLSSRSALSCNVVEADEEGRPDAAAAPELMVEPGVFDDVPVGARRPVTAAHLRALRALAPDADQLYLVLSAANGPEVMPLSVLEQRVKASGPYLVIAAADDLPAALLPEVSVPAPDPDSPETGSVWPARVHQPQHPDFGRSLGIAEGEQVVARLSGLFGEPRNARAALRSLALARTVPDLRELEGGYDETGYRRSTAFPRDVWHGLLTMEQLDLEPFEPVSDDAWHSGSGLPLGVLARVQLYTTDATGHFQGRAHSPHCAHQRHDGGLTRDYDLTTVEGMLHAARFDPCSKCGGYATRRLTEAQLAYYRAAHQVHDAAQRIRSALANPQAARDTIGLTVAMKEWNDTPATDTWFETKIQASQWRRTVRELHQQAQRLE